MVSIANVCLFFFFWQFLILLMYLVMHKKYTLNHMVCIHTHTCILIYLFTTIKQIFLWVYLFGNISQSANIFIIFSFYWYFSAVFLYSILHLHFEWYCVYTLLILCGLYSLKSCFTFFNILLWLKLIALEFVFVNLCLTF